MLLSVWLELSQTTKQQYSRVAILITNCLLEPVVLPERFAVAVLEAEATANVVGALGLSHVSTVGTSPEVVQDRSDMDAMIPESLDSSDRENNLYMPLV